MKKTSNTHLACCSCLLMLFLLFGGITTASAQLSGVKTIAGSGADYPTLADAVAALNLQGVGFGGVTFEIAAGHLETTSNLLITASGSATDSIVFKKSGAGADPLFVAAPGTGTLDGIIKIKGAAYITFDGIALRDAVTNTTQTTRMEWGFAILKAGPANGSAHINIRNCTISLDNNPLSVGIYGANHDELSVSEITVTSVAGINQAIHISQNAISNVFSAIQLTGSGNALYPDRNHIITGNTVTAFGGDSTLNINVIAAVNQRNVVISLNQVSGSGILAKDLNVIHVQGGADTAWINKNIVSVSSSQPATGRQIRAINSGTATALTALYMQGNVIKNCTVSGGFTGINNTAAAQSVSISSDSIYNITMISANGFSGINNAAGTVVTGAQVIRKNVIYNVSGLGTRSVINGNTINGSVDSNQVYHIASTSLYADVYGIIYGTYHTAGVVSCIGNTVHHINGGGYYTIGVKATGGTVQAYENAIYDVTSGVTTTGLWVVGTQDVARNKIFNLYSTSPYDDFGDGANAAAVVALHADAGIRSNIKMNIHNNLISSLHSPYSTNGNDIRAIVTNTIAGDSVYLSYNTVYMNAKPVSSYWGSSVLFHSHFNTFLQASNNIFVNTSESKGSGTTSISRAYSNTTLSKYAKSSDRNLFYAGKPSARNLIYTDGSAKDSMMYQYQARVGNGTDSLSFSEMPVFLDTVGTSLNYLRIDTLVPTLIESGGNFLATAKGDFQNPAGRQDTLYPRAAQVRGGGQRPDVGAFEGDYTPAPQMTFLASEVTKYGGDAYRNVNAQQMQRIMIVTTGTANRLYLDSFVFTVATSSNLSDIKAARVYYTVGRNAFDTSMLYGLTIPGSSSFSVKGTMRLLGADTNYFWLAYDVAATATPGNIIDASCTDIALSSGVFTPPTVNAATVRMVPQPLFGNYRVGSGQVYPTITAAITDLNTKGISSSVSFELMDNLYSASTGEVFPLRINTVVGAGMTDTVLVKVSGTTDVTIAANNGPAFILNGADHITINGADPVTDSSRLSISGTTAAIWLQNADGADSATYNSFNKLALSASTIGIGMGGTTVSTTSSGINHHYNKIENCTISGATVAIYQGGSAIGKSRGNIIRGNRITRGGILVTYHDSIQILNNTLTNITASIYGISLGLTTITSYAPNGLEVTNARVSGNEIWAVVLANSASVGIAVAPATSGTNTIDNNLVYDVRSSGTSTGRFAAGLYLGGGLGSTTRVYYNTVILRGTTTRTTPSSYAVAIGGADPVVDLKNNIFYNTQLAGANSASYAIGMASATFANLLSNNNAFFASGANAAFAVTGAIGIKTAGTVRADLVSWQAVTLQDTNSLHVDPVMDSVSGFRPNVLPVISGGKPLPGFDADKAGTQRNMVNPTIGAYEVLPVYNDAGVVSARVVNNELHVLLRNYGDNAISLLNVEYSVNNGIPVITSVPLLIPPRDTASAVITPFTTPNGINSIKIYTSGPNGFTDANAINDTLVMPLSYPLSGTYTVGGTNPDYATIGAAVNELNVRGVSAPVKFMIRSGVYNEQAQIWPVRGASAAARVTFTSEAGHADSVTITYPSTGTTDNYIFKLAGASFITLNKLTLKTDLNGNAQYGNLVELTDSASYDSIGYCNLTGRPLLSDFYYHTLVFANLCYGANNVINHNNFKDGARSIYYNGVVDPARNILPGADHVIEGNTISGSSGWPVNVAHIANPKINRNVITTAMGSVGLYIDGVDSSLQVIGNKIKMGPTGTGLIIQNARGTVARQGIIASNEINVMDGDGIRHTANGNWDGGIYYVSYFHNTVKVESANGYAANFNLDNASWYSSAYTSVDVYNNVFVNLGGGVALRAPLKNMYDTHMLIDNNSLYTNGTYLARKAISTNTVLDSLYTSLQAWRNSGPYDHHSFAHRPVFRSTTDLSPDPADTLAWLLNGRATHLAVLNGTLPAAINKDVNQNDRPVTYDAGVPDIGAHEFTPVSTPPLATAYPASIPGFQPVDTTQIFMFYDDTVAVITWKAWFDIPSVAVRQYSGVRPVATSPGDHHMYFYTSVDASGTSSYSYDMNLYYRENWRGTIADENDIRLAKKDPITPWNIPNSWAATVDTARNILRTELLTGFSLFSGTYVNNPMPVRMVSFEGVRVKDGNRLTWITASELNNEGFGVERSLNGKTFGQVAFIAGKGTTNAQNRYTYVDPFTASAAGVYYRLKQVDRNGSVNYSNTILISSNTQPAATGSSVYPNPFSEVASVRLNTASEGKVTIDVFTLTGKQVCSSVFNLEAGDHTLALTETGTLESGIYVAVIRTAETKEVVKLIKQ